MLHAIFGNEHFPHLVERDFTAAAPNQRCVADITYVATWTRFVYVALVSELFSRCILGWWASTSLRADLALDAAPRVHLKGEGQTRAAESAGVVRAALFCESTVTRGRAGEQ